MHLHKGAWQTADGSLRGETKRPKLSKDQNPNQSPIMNVVCKLSFDEIQQKVIQRTMARRGIDILLIILLNIIVGMYNCV